ncbi:unnamed protein product (macronuclear) [Paramecium tetraurelia]|uniref:Phorbol-ester/DAG-type domain-containing protein n=1 Tax=Paramecium tetraurelia TaxID=5888 RepID=A0CXF0_PARTE|nr:uncharacterized protein GSPATT00011099001 [Paramecium tetraurelia]CAK75467.1 unnamed protein product [Paramecium tetraurelia]|eukprot:XP_001442864.1 hypothetical protein (macronuclear) [Paramecium tetraurelia strain d4-2]
MLKLDQQELIIQRIKSKKPIFKTVSEIEQFPKLIKSREAIQKSILSQIQRSVSNIDVDPLTYGQKELKDVMNQLEEQLKTVFLPTLLLDEKKKSKLLIKQESKQLDYEESNHPKKQRVDKNKCRKCKQSTIPMILNLLQQTENQDTNPHVTMKSIRQQIVQKSQKKEEQSESKVPYIAFDYSDRIIICKRCRFKFHAECVQVHDNINDWICDYCQDRIQELKSSNQWDYINNKQLKQQVCPGSEQKKIYLSLIERIQKKQKVFIIEEMEITSFKPIDQISIFLKKYPHYRGQNGKIKYPVLEKLALDYPEVLEIKQKPQPYMINSNLVEDILRIQTSYQIMFPNCQIPQNVNQDYIEKNFYEILMNLLNEYFNDFMLSDMSKFEKYCHQANFQATAFLEIMNFLYVHQENQMKDLIKKTWIECVIQIDQIINYDCESNINKINFNSLEFSDQIYILSLLTEGLYDLDKMKEQIKQKDSSMNYKQSHLKILFQHNQSAFINCGTFLGQDADEQQYFYFTHVPSSIFVETMTGWGQYTLSDLSELMNALNLQGVNESNLFENLELISQVKLFDNTTPLKPQNRLIQKQQYNLENIEVIEQFLLTEEAYTKYLQSKDLIWIENHQKQDFYQLLKNEKELQSIIQALKIFYNGLLQLKSNDGYHIKPFKLFKLDFQLANQLAIFVDNASSQHSVYISLITLNLFLDEYQQYQSQKELQNKRNQVLRKLPSKANPKEVKQIKKKSKLKPIEDESIEQELSLQYPRNLANKREKRENAGKNPNINFDQQTKNQKKISCTSCKKQFSQASQCVQCSRCNKPFHQECLVVRKDYCKNCVRNGSKKQK